MNVEYIHYQVEPAAVSDFVAAFREALAILEHEPTVLYHELVQNSDHPEKFVVRIDWRSRESQRAYLTSEGYAAFMTLVKPFNRAFVSMQFHDPVVVSARRGAADGATAGGA